MAELRRQEEDFFIDDPVETSENNQQRIYADGQATLNVNAPVSGAPADRAPIPFPGQNVSSTDFSTPLFSSSEVEDLRARWGGVQAGFVDEPRRAVQEADQLVGTVVEQLTAGFAGVRSGLEKQWSEGADVSTEELRLALQQYRSFFGRLLSI